MIVFLDANALMQDPMLSGTVWHVLAHARETLDVRLVTSEVVVAEAVSGYGRRIKEQLDKVDKWTSALGSLGAAEVARALVAALTTKQTSYADYLDSTLVEAGVEVVQVPNVDHMSLVVRSVQRRRPCDDNGDGYRDTLIWLTVLDLAVENPDEDIVLVTRDRDFLMDGNDQGFHDDLLEDLVQIGAKDRVRVGTDLADVALAMADRSTTDLKSFKSGLQNEALVRFVGTLVRDLENGQLDPQECALPRATLANYLQGVGEVDDFAYSVRGSLGDDEAVAEVSFESAAEIVLTLPEGVSPEQGDATPPIYPQGTVVHLINKPLAFRGLVRLDRYGRPLGGEITKVTARPDDPGLRAWVPAPWSGLNVNPLAETLKKLNADLTKNAYKDPLADMMKKLTADQEKYRVNLDPLADMMKKLTADQEKYRVNLDPLADMMKKLTADLEKYRVNLDPLADMMKKLTADQEKYRVNLDPFASGWPSTQEPADDAASDPESTSDEEAHGERDLDSHEGDQDEGSPS